MASELNKYKKTYASHQNDYYQNAKTILIKENVANMTVHISIFVVVGEFVGYVREGFSFLVRGCVLVSLCSFS